MTELCLECGSEELMHNDYAVRSPQPDGQAMQTGKTISETHCLSCGWVNLHRN